LVVQQNLVQMGCIGRSTKSCSNGLHWSFNKILLKLLYWSSLLEICFILLWVGLFRFCVRLFLYTIIHLGYDLTEGPNICNVSTTAKLSFVLVLDIPVFFIIALIIIVYSVIIMRIVQHHKKIFNQNDMTAITIINNRNISSVRSMRRNVLTLGAIILITLAANVPTCVTSSYILYSGIHVRTSISLKISNHFLLLSPVLDPVMHVLRIRGCALYI
jgi:hypothetical protein